MLAFSREQRFLIAAGGFYVVLALLTSSGRASVVTSLANESLTDIPSNISVQSNKIVLSYNNLSLCQNGSFGRFQNLEILYLDHNAIRTIESAAFNGTVLRELYLDHNRLTSIPQFIGIGDTLNVLDLRWNSLTTADIGDFLMLTSLKDFRLSGNPLASFNASECRIPTDNTSHCTHRLQILYLQDLDPGVVSRAGFSGLSGLVTLYLDRTGLTSFEQISNVLALNETLQLLSLRENRIEFVPEDVLHSLGELGDLRLENNRIKVFNEIITSVQSNNRPGSLLQVYLYDNPTVCRCDWSWLLGTPYITESPDRGRLLNIEKGIVIHINYRLCEVGGPVVLMDYNWNNLTQELLCPPTTTQEYVSTSTSKTTPMATTTVVAMTTTDAPVTSPPQTTTSSATESASPSHTTESVTMETTETPTTSLSVEMTTPGSKDTIQLSWNTWIAWSECTSSCGGGYRYSLKVCDVINLAANCSTPLKRGEEVVLYYSVSQQTCNTQTCPIDGYWLTWSNWSACSATCGTGTITRSRMCVGPEYGGEACDGHDHENDVCNMDECVEKPVQPVDLHNGEYYLEADRRPASVGIGVMSMMLLGFELAIVLILDIHSITMACKQLRKRNCAKSCKKSARK